MLRLKTKMYQMVIVFYVGTTQLYGERDLKFTRFWTIISPYLDKFINHNKLNTAFSHEISPAVKTFSCEFREFFQNYRHLYFFIRTSKVLMRLVVMLSLKSLSILFLLF